MTSGQFRSLEISSILVNREARQRKELPEIPNLALSIKLRGLINPILVQRDSMLLIAGERRLEACRSLGWTHIAAQFEDEAEESSLKSLELEENIRRVDLPWQDQCLAIHEYHVIQLSKDPSWSQPKTAVALNMSENDLLRKINIAKEIIGGNTRVLEAPKLSTAIGITSRALERKAQAEAESVKTMFEAKPETKVESILIADFNEWAKSYDGPRFNFIHCDFPYGIGADKFNQGSAPLHGGYSDSEADYWRLCATLRDNYSRIATDSAHLVFWFSMKFYTETLKFFSNSPLELNHLPLIWLKSDNTGIIPDPQRGPRQIYETALFGASGDRKIVRSKSNAYAGPTSKDIHMSIKPQEMLQYFFEMFVDSNTRMLDPTCGSGGALRAAEALGATSVLGLERNEEFALSARTALEKSRKTKRP